MRLGTLLLQGSEVSNTGALKAWRVQARRDPTHTSTVVLRAAQSSGLPSYQVTGAWPSKLVISSGRSQASRVVRLTLKASAITTL